jgi:hypothetical protein
MTLGVWLMRPPRRTLILLAVMTACLAGLIHLALRLPGVPYNVRELFGRDASPRWVALFSLLLTWMVFGPAWVSAWLAKRPTRAIALPLWVIGVSLVSWSMLRSCVTPESLHDILGSPVLGWGEEPELLARFLGLNGGVVLLQIVPGLWVTAIRRSGWRRGALAGAAVLLWSVPWLVLARMVVITWADTDNLVELIRTQPIPGELALGLLGILLAMNGAFLGYAWPPPWSGRLLVAALVCVALIVPGWYLLNLGLAPKVNTSFSAVRFLLGPDRRTSLSQADLFLRWCVVQVGMVIALSLGHLATRWIMSDKPEPGGARR